MTPVIADAVFWFCIGAVLSLLATQSHWKWKLNAANETSKKRNETLTGDLANAQRNLTNTEIERNNAEFERDAYRKIAESREVKPFDLTPQRVERHLWKARRYSHHPAKSLPVLFEDLTSAANASEVSVALTIHGTSNWAPLLRKFWERPKNTQYGKVPIPVSNIGPFKFEGPAARVTSEIEAFFQDPHHGFVHPADRSWLVAESALTLDVDLIQVSMEIPKYPEIHYVEVAVSTSTDKDRTRLISSMNDHLDALEFERRVEAAVEVEVTSKLASYTAQRRLE